MRIGLGMVLTKLLLRADHQQHYSHSILIQQAAGSRGLVRHVHIASVSLCHTHNKAGDEAASRVVRSTILDQVQRRSEPASAQKSPRSVRDILNVVKRAVGVPLADNEEVSALADGSQDTA